MRIGLLGFSFNDANKGCEALTFSLLHILQEMQLEKVTIVAFNCSPNKILESLYSNFDYDYPKVRIKDNSAKKLFRTCDVVLDATYGDGFSDIYFFKIAFVTTLMKRMVVASKTDLILMPQTYGPFKNLLLKGFAMRVINKSNTVYSRDIKSIEFIQSYIKKDIKHTVDLAFALPYKKDLFSFNSNKLKIGLNISGLQWNGGFHKNNQFGLSINYKEYVVKIIGELLSKGYSVYLIPHVIENESDNLDGDVCACNLLIKRFPQLEMAPLFTSPIEAKSYISNMDFFIGARMHATIAAFSANVPVIPFSYSRKFEGLYEQLNYPYIIHGMTESLEEAIDNTLEWIEIRNDIQKTVEKANIMANKLMNSFIEDFTYKIKCLEKKCRKLQK